MAIATLLFNTVLLENQSRPAARLGQAIMYRPNIINRPADNVYVVTVNDAKLGGMARERKWMGRYYSLKLF